MYQDSTNSSNKGNRDLAQIINTLRENAARMPIRNIRDRVDQHMMMSIADVAEWKGRLGLFLDVRSMGYAVGTDEHYSSASLRRLCNVQAPQGGTRLVDLEARMHPRQAKVYAVNPDYPHVWSFGTARPGRHLPRSAAGDPRLFGDWGIRGMDDPVAHGGMTLTGFFQNQVADHLDIFDGQFSQFQKTTQAGDRRALLIGRTELGVALGKPVIAVALALVDGWLMYTEIARNAHLGSKYVLEKVLKKKLAPLGLAQSDMSELANAGTRKAWRTGISLEECHPDNLPDTVAARLRRWAREQQDWKSEHPVKGDRAGSKRPHMRGEA